MALPKADEHNKIMLNEDDWELQGAERICQT